MINLLPSSEKEVIKQEKINRLIIILGSLILLVLFFLCLLLLSIKIYTSGQVEAQKILVAQEKELARNSNILNLEKEYETVNQNFKRLDSFYYNQPDLTLLFEDISKTLPHGLHLTRFSLTPFSEKDYEFHISISGYAPNREILLNFKKNLEARGKFGEIYFPASNWLEPADINFSATFNTK